IQSGHGADAPCGFWSAVCGTGLLGSAVTIQSGYGAELPCGLYGVRCAAPLWMEHGHHPKRCCTPHSKKPFAALRQPILSLSIPSVAAKMLCGVSVAICPFNR